jgi:hypothetical protein
MTFPHLNRRTHLYLGLFLLPWFFLYGVSSIPFSHPEWGRSVYGDARWNVRFERPYELPNPTGDLKQVGADLMREAGFAGVHGAYRPNPNRVNVYIPSLRSATQVIYDAQRKTIRVEDREFRWDHWLTGFHARGGFQHDNFLNDAWAVVVDLVSVGFLLWVATGIYMWWHLPRQRNWGWVALGGGVLTFAAFVALL